MSHPSGLEKTLYGFKIVGPFQPSELDGVEKHIYEKMETLIAEDEGISSLGEFDEDTGNPCIQSWLVDVVIQDDLQEDIFNRDMYDGDHLEELMSLLEQAHREIGGGFRPTALLDYDEDPDLYGAAELAESTFNDLEKKAMLFAGVIAGKLGYDISPIKRNWEENGWDQDIEVLDTLIKG